MNSYYVYLLESTKHSTYIGATIDLDHRLRQHNMEIKGGAKATSIKVKSGETWKRVCHVEGFPTWNEALKFEWAWKFQSRKLNQKMFPLTRRKEALTNLLALERPTSKAIPYSEYITPLNVIWENQ
jgi:structure-specific endonuclease subunit SLX1|tara:strand:- start:103 stop:480 length:378 start_codon:yes stop_codon:yes gene_type:complete